MGPAAILEIFVNAQTGTASAKMTKLNSQMKASELQANRSSNAIGGKLTKGMKMLGVAAGAAAAYGLYKAVSVGAEFEKQMDSLGAVTEASGKQIKRFEKQALALGESTQYTANQVAEAQTELAKGGLTAKQILGGALPAALSLAAAGQIELAEAASTTVNVMKLFGLKGKDTAQIADMLATAANKTTADVGDFALALKQGGSVAKLAGMNLNETVTTLEALAEAGIKSSDAGTSLKAFFVNIGTPSKKAKTMMDELGLSIFKQNGELKKLPALAAELRNVFGEVSKKEFLEKGGTIAGSDAIRTLYSLYDAGPKKIKALEQANKKQGTAQEIARQKMDNLRGDWEQFTGALETGGIKLYQVLKGPLRSVTQWMTGAVQAVSNFDYGHAIEETEEFATKAHEMGNISFAGLDFNAFDTYWAALKKEAEIYVAYLKALPGVAVTVFNAVASATQWVVKASKDLAGWIAHAWRNVTGFVGSLIPVKVALLAVKLAMAPVVGLVMGLFKAIKILSPVIGMVANNFKAVWVVAMKVAIAIIQVLLKFIGNIGAVVGDVVGLVSNLLRGNWGAAWRNAKQLVVDIWHTILDLLKGGWTVIKTLFSSGTKAMGQILGNSVGAIGKVADNVGDALKAAFSSAWDKIEGIFTDGANAVIDVINSIIDVINVIPGVPDIGKVGHLGGDGGGGKPVKHQYGSRRKHEEALNRFSGGPITKPIAIVGEEAPRHNEWVIATNPAYKKANLGYWAQAGADLGVPGFATGGLLGKAAGAVGDVVGSVVGNGADYFIGKLPKPDIPPPLAGVGPYLIDQVSDYIKSGFDQEKFGSLVGLGGSGKKLMEEISKQKHWSFADWWALDAAETSHGANLSNPTSSARLRGQFLDMNYGKYGPGSDPAKNPSMSQQIIAMARYIAERYGNPSRAWAFHQAHNYYAKGGLLDGGGGSAPGAPKAGNPFNAKAMRATPTTPPQMEMLSASGYKPRTIERIKAKAQQIATAFTGYVWGGGHGEGNNVTANGLDCSAAVAKLMQQSGFNFPVAVSGDYASRFMSGAGDLFTIWSNADHTFANIEGKDWGTNTSNGLGYATHTHSGFTPVHPALADSDAHSFKEDVPAVFRGAHTGSLSFGPIPKSLHGISKELGKRRGELKRYRAAAAEAHKKGKPKVEHALTGNIRDLEGRIRELERAQAKERREAAKRKITRKFGKQLSKLTGFEELIAAKERSFDAKSQFAEQLVALEPVMPEVPEKATEVQREAIEKGHLENLSRYIGTQEEPAYQALLGSAGEWRNTILSGQEKAAGDWQKGKTLGGLEGNWEDKIISTGNEIEHINDFTEKVADCVSSWKKKHGKNPFPDWLKDQVKKDHQERARLPVLRFREQELREVLGKGRESFYPGKARIMHPAPPFAGSGSFEEALQNVQGIHWPAQHEKLASLPASRLAGAFGGVIWDVQTSLSELGMKIQDAKVQGGAGGTEEDSGAERLALIEEQLRKANQRNLVFERQMPIIDAYEAKGFAGMFAKGGSIPAGMWGIVGERGPEPVFAGSGAATVVSNRDAQAAFGSSPTSVLVQVVEGDPSKTKVFVDDKQVEAVVEKVNKRQGRGARSIGSSRAGRLG